MLLEGRGAVLDGGVTLSPSTTGLALCGLASGPPGSCLPWRSLQAAGLARLRPGEHPGKVPPGFTALPLPPRSRSLQWEGPSTASPQVSHFGGPF